MEFHGDGASALGVWLVGAILCSLTLYIYFPWYLNNIYEWKWTNTSISGRRFSFQKDPGGIFVLWVVNTLLTVCTLGFYKPWADCKYIDCERVQRRWWALELGLDPDAVDLLALPPVACQRAEAA